MNNALLGILITIGFLALYWALFGQWKFNKMMTQDSILVSQKQTKSVSKDNKMLRGEK